MPLADVMPAHATLKLALNMDDKLVKTVQHQIGPLYFYPFTPDLSRI